MKAALGIWGASPALFRRGYAKETNDAEIVKATLAKPGTVLQRAVGARGVFKEHAELPNVSGRGKPTRAAITPKVTAISETEPIKQERAHGASDRTAAQLYEAARRKRADDVARAEAVERRARERQERMIERAEAAVRHARQDHDERIAAIEKEREKLNLRAQEEEKRWRASKRRLEASLRQARTES